MGCRKETLERLVDRIGFKRRKRSIDTVHADANVVFLGTWNLCADFVVLVVFGDVDADVTDPLAVSQSKRCVAPQFR